MSKETPNEKIESENGTPGTLSRTGTHVLQLDDSRTIHVVRSHEDGEQLRKEVGDPDLNYVIHGSDEHVFALQEARNHHTVRADNLRKKHHEAFHLMDIIHTEIDHIVKDINRFTGAPTDDEIVNQHLNKFGRSDNIRVHNYGKLDEESQAEPSMTMKLYKNPVIRQYFYKGMIWRAKAVEEVASFELFVDLLFVGIIAINGDTASEEPSGLSFLRFCITFIPSWKIWSDVTLFVSWFETDDVQERVGILFILACLVGYTTNIVGMEHATYNQLIAFYVAARLFLMLISLFMCWAIPIIRPMMINNAILIIIPTALWIGSMFIDEFNHKLPLIWIAIFLEIFGSALTIFLIRGSRIISKRLFDKTQEIFAYVPATNIEHKTERTGAFVSLVFGYTVVAILYQNTSHFGVNAFFGKAILGLVQCYVFNWIYFDIDASHHHTHAIRRHAVSSLVWLSSHLPFIMGFVISGAALSKMVVARDCADAHLEELTEFYHHKSLDHVEMGIRWFYCGGLAVAMVMLTLIAISHVHIDPENLRIKKRYRMAVRFAVALVWLLLPLAGDRLNSLQLISVTTGMTIFVLAFDTYGCGRKGESYVDMSTRCTYETARKGRKLQIETVGGKRAAGSSTAELSTIDTTDKEISNEGMMDFGQ